MSVIFYKIEVLSSALLQGCAPYFISSGANSGEAEKIREEQVNSIHVQSFLRQSLRQDRAAPGAKEDPPLHKMLHGALTASSPPRYSRTSTAPAMVRLSGVT